MKTAGKKATGYYQDSIAGSSGAYGKTIRVLCECELNPSSYPYTYAIVPSTFNKGEE